MAAGRKRRVLGLHECRNFRAGHSPSPVHFPGAPAGARYEWCINSAVVNPADDSVIVNSEDATLYRWDLARNTLAEKIRLNRPRPEAYTPTIIGSDGTVYAINKRHPLRRRTLAGISHLITPTAVSRSLTRPDSSDGVHERSGVQDTQRGPVCAGA